MNHSDRNLNQLNQDNDDEIFERSETYMRRPESARLKIPGRDSLFTRGAGEETSKYSQANDVHHTPVKEAQEQEEDCPDGDADE